jgi:hypothetical protein
MGYYGKIEEKNRAINLRKRGFSYSEIRKEINASKSSLSKWCRDVILSVDQLERLKNKKLTGGEKGRLLGAKVNQKKRESQIKEMFDFGKKEVGKLSQRERFIAGIALYIGDGLKGDKAIGFSNSDPIAIKFMMSWLREFAEIPENKFHGQIWIHDNLDEKKARTYWSKLTKIPENQFAKSYIAKNKVGSNKIRKQLHRYGVLAIRVPFAEKQRKILGWMACLTVK